MKIAKHLLLFCACYFLSACATAPHSHDPLEPINRATFSFNQTADTYVLKPVAKGYRAVVPTVIRTGVQNFFRNLGVLNTAFNDALQLKGKDLPADLARFTTNFIFGLGGFFDVATDMGIPYHQEDFGQTLGSWGVGSGPYLMLPILGPSTLRDGMAKPVDFLTDPIYHLNGESPQWGLTALQAVDTRSNLFEAEAVLNDSAIDKYSFIRDLWLQKRRFQVHDGDVPDSSTGGGPKSLRELELEEFGE